MCRVSAAERQLHWEELLEYYEHGELDQIRHWVDGVVRPGKVQ